MPTDQLDALATRYTDGYRVANAIVGLGQAVKVGGFLLAAVAVLGTFGMQQQPTMFNPNPTPSPIIIAGTLLFGAVIAFCGWVVGVIVSAQGQMLRATLDGSVNNSPFLTNDLRARIMSL